MVIRILLILALIVTIAYAVRNRKHTPLVSMATLVFGLVGIFCVAMPDITTAMAHLLGVGRGADLLLYCFIISSVLMILNLHLRLLRLQGTLTDVVREFALSKSPPADVHEPAYIKIGNDFS